ncbi:hypothetical protein L083_5482 [Actinoplanes sp. N902-109]|nr:hypothetical protein L083_5482 [Actinoplanes sp. N902-109]
MPMAAAAYLLAGVVVRRRGGWWPPGRTASWCAGLTAIGLALRGPLATAAHHDFTAHMATHLLLGMAAPVLLVLAAPVTLTLRALPVRHARTVSRVLRSRPVRFASHPVTAAVLDAGGLWLLYRSALFPAMLERPWLHALIQLHVVVAGYLFTAAMVGVDPAPHRPGRPLRAATLVVFLAAHGILAKVLYGHPPPGVPAGPARTGAELMYYGGDLLDLVLIAVFCAQWYAATDPRRRAAAPRIPGRAPDRPWRLPAELRRTGHDER